MKKYLASNYALHAIEGSLYFAGLCFVAFETVLPQVIKSLGGSTWMVSVAPAMVTIGCAIPSMFTAGIIDRQPRKMPALAWSGFFQRIPFVLAGLILLGAVWLPSRLVVWAALLAPLLSGLACGFTLPAWFDLVARTVAPERITSLYALRYAAGAISGMAIGGLVKIILGWQPNHFGYGTLFLCAGVILFTSYYFFLKIQEPVQPEVRRLRPPVRYREVLSDRNIQSLLWCRFFSCGSFIGISFLPIHLLKTLHLPQSWLGYFVIAVITGAVSGNIFATRWSRKHSCRTGLLIGVSGYLLTFACSLIAGHWSLALLTFFLLGFARDCWNSFISTLNTALPPKRLRAKSIAIVNTLYSPGLILACLLGALLWSRTHSFALVIGTAMLSQGLCLAVIRRLPRV